MGRSSVPGRRSRELTLPIARDRVLLPDAWVTWRCIRDREHVNQDEDLCVLQPLDTSWICAEPEGTGHWKRNLKAKSEMKLKLRMHPFLLMRLEVFPKMFSMHRYVSAHGQTSWNTGNAQGRGDETVHLVMSMRSIANCACTRYYPCI